MKGMHVSEKGEVVMVVKSVCSPDVYRKIMNADQDKKDDIYRYELMLPFQGKWDCYHIPLKAPREGVYDLIMANNRMGLLPPSQVNLTTRAWIEAISDQGLWDACQRSIENAHTKVNEGAVGTMAFPAS